MTLRPTCKGLLPEKPLCLAIELLYELARKQSSVKDLDPAANPILHQAKPQDGNLLLCPPRRGSEVPPVYKVLLVA